MTTYTTLWQRLIPAYDEGEARAIVRLVLADGFGLSWADVLCGKVSELSANDRALLEKIMQRLAGGEPVQYVLGHETFCGRTFRVAPGVLIPRPETEELCHRIVTDTQTLSRPEGERWKILDIGTGSGCIAATLSLDIPQAQVSAWDLSVRALAIARENGQSLGATVSWQEQDALNPPADTERWDCIVSNPPYICRHEQAAMARHVLDHEPEEALFVPDDDPLRFYRAIACYARKALRPGGRLYFEINPLHAAELEQLLHAAGFGYTAICPDSYGRQRFSLSIL